MRQSILITAVIALLVALGCNDRPRFFVEEGDLSFSVDTIYFDSIFTDFASPTERVTVYNNSGKNVRISKIEFEDGRDFSMIFDGLPGNVQEDYELADGDSAVAFVSFDSEIKDQFLRDRLLFTVGDNVQDVDIEAYVFDGVFLKDSTLTPPFGSTVVWDPALKYVVDGPLVVPDGVTLIIPAGTQVYFTSRKDAGFNLVSSLIVFGSLRVTGEKGNEVVFQQTRFGDRYEENPDQWFGIAFGNISTSNTIEHAVIKNALIGVYQEYGNSGFFPKVHLKSTEIRNMSAYGILGVGLVPTLDNTPMILAENCLIHNCNEGTFRTIGGGFYRFNQCTFVNYTINFTRNSPQIILENYDPEQGFELPLTADFNNCIVWGSEEEEYVQDTIPNSNFNITFDNTIVRTTLPLTGSFIYKNLDPEFVEPISSKPYDRDYRLGEGSPAIDKGVPIAGISDDLDNAPRDAQPDLGAYEYQE